MNSLPALRSSVLPPEPLSPTLPPSNTPKTLRKRRDSMTSFSHRNQTLIVYDWDDTLFPTTWLVDDIQMQDSEQHLLPEADRLTLLECSLSALTILRYAVKVADQVLIVTLAKKGWLESSMKRFMPDLADELESLGVKIVYARDCLTQTSNGNAPDPDDLTSNPWVQAKGRAIARECEAFYEGRCWSNIIAIGDAEYEILGSQMAVQQWASKNRRVALQLPRLKTVKFISGPSGQRLIQELDVLEELLPALVTKDLSIGIDMADICTSHTACQNAHQLLVTAENNVADPFSDAVIGGVLWKLCDGSAPGENDRWRQRRMWLSKAGTLWYESLKDGRPQPLFHGRTITGISVTPLGDLADGCATNGASMQIGEQNLFAMEFRVHSQRSSHTKIFAAESAEERMQWISLCNSFMTGI